METTQARISVVTNACALDADRLRMTLPHWLRVFGDRAAELVVVIDPAPPSGRIASLHAATAGEDVASMLAEVQAVLDELTEADSRVRSTMLPSGATLDAILQRWFRNGRPLRCQAGTPIAAFIAAFESATEPLVARLDCDMLLHDAGWIDAAITSLCSGGAEWVEPPRCGLRPERTIEVSTRVSMLHYPRFSHRLLPMRPWPLDRLRRFHRWWHGRPPWLALEQMLEKERRAGRLRFHYLGDEPNAASLGMSLHVPTRDHARLPIIESVVAAVEAGEVPAAQWAAGPNFRVEAWA